MNEWNLKFKKKAENPDYASYVCDAVDEIIQNLESDSFDIDRTTIWFEYFCNQLDMMDDENYYEENKIDPNEEKSLAAKMLVVAKESQFDEMQKWELIIRDLEARAK